MFLRELWHPFPFALFLWHIGRLPEEDARDIRRHLEEDECAHCTALIRRMAWASEPVRVPAGAFPDTIPSQEFVSEDGQLRVVIQQDEKAAPGGWC
jgi:hypothetical protein